MDVLGVDIGGSAVKAAPVDMTAGRLLATPRRRDTPSPLAPPAMAEAIADLARAFRWKGAIGIGCPGNVRGAQIVGASNLHPDFRACEFRPLVETLVCGPVSLANDAEAAATAEIVFGAGRNISGLTLVLTLGTGVGSALAYRGVAIPCELGQLRLRGRPAERSVAASVRTQKNLSWAEWGARLHAYITRVEEVVWPELIIIGGGVSANHRRFFRYIRSRAPLVSATFLNDAGIVGAALCAQRDLERSHAPARRAQSATSRIA